MIIVISESAFVKNEHKVIHQLFDNGLEIFHVRKKQRTETEIRKFIEGIPQQFHNRLVLHSHYALVEEYKLKGIQVSSSDTNSYYYGTTGISFHSIREIQESNKKFDYAFLSPVFDSISKQSYTGTLSIQNLKENKELFLRRNIYALSGIDEDKIETIKSIGFPGIALLGAIWQNPGPVEKFNKIKRKWMEIEITC